MDETKKVNIDPQEYFDYVKSMKRTCTDDYLTSFEKIIQKELSKAMAMGQNFMVRRLAYTAGVVSKERELVKRGVDVFVLKDSIEELIKLMEPKVVKIIELENYPRTIPDDISERVAELKELNLFDNFYVLFTDYTGKIAREVEKTQIRKDPIIFGAFEHKIDGFWDVSDRFYFIGDWEDEYCDLTLTKMVDKMTEAGKENPVYTLSIPEATPESVRTYLNNLEELERGRFKIRKPEKVSAFSKVRTSVKGLFDKLWQ